jgi:ABC-type multidrug transport system permease subunit
LPKISAITRLHHNRIVRTVGQAAKWVLVAWLLYPLRRRMHLPIDFTRSALGILLFIVFAGKMFYDSVVWQQVTGRSRDSWRDLLSLAAMILIIAMLLAVTIFFIGLYIVNFTKRNMQIEPEM